MPRYRAVGEEGDPHRANFGEIADEQDRLADALANHLAVGRDRRDAERVNSNVARRVTSRVEPSENCGHRLDAKAIGRIDENLARGRTRPAS